MQRRNFIKQVCKASIVCAAPISITSLQSCSDYDDENNSSNSNSNIVTEISIDLNDLKYSKLKTVSESIVTGSTDFDRAGLLLLRKSQEELVAYSRRCPHAGTSINVFVAGSASCPNHGAKFKTDGSPFSGGPTNTSLISYAVDLNGSIVTIYK